jgi:hypothetical protein
LLTTIEASITAHLTEALQQAGLNNRGVKLHAFPSNAAELGRVQQRVQVLVGYKGATLADVGEEPIQRQANPVQLSSAPQGQPARAIGTGNSGAGACAVGHGV